MISARGAVVLTTLALLAAGARAEASGAVTATRSNTVADRLELRAQLGSTVGSETFGLSLSHRGLTGDSELTWPTGAPTIGLHGVLRLGRWRLWAAGQGNLADPYAPMRDDDFLEAAEYDLPRTQVSSTESTTSLRALLLEVGLASPPLWSVGQGGGRSLELRLLVGYRHQHASFDGRGAAGWQLGPSDERFDVAFGGEDRLVHFESHRIEPFLGLSLGGRFGRRRPLEIEAQVRLLVAHTEDYDDHLRRNKEMWGQTNGVGVMVGLAPRWRVARHVSIGVDLELGYAAGSGTLEQAYYADDPDLVGDQLHEVIADADFSRSGLRFSALLAASLHL